MDVDFLLALLLRLPRNLASPVNVNDGKPKKRLDNCFGLDKVCFMLKKLGYGHSNTRPRDGRLWEGVSPQAVTSFRCISHPSWGFLFGD